METFSAKQVFEDIRNYLAGRFVGATRDEFLLEEVVKLIFCKFHLNESDTATIDEIELSGMYRRAFKQVLLQYREIYSDPDAAIELDPISIKFVDDRLSTLDLDNIERDIIGDAYEIFMGDAVKGQSGQFFTPQNAATALVQMVSPKPSDKVLDLACGTGGFLVATYKYWKCCYDSVPSENAHNLYGVDKDEYLTRLSKIHLACLARTSSNVCCADSLVWDEKVLGESENAFDVILTNPPFGSNIQSGTLETLRKYLLAYKYKKSKDNSFIQSCDINESVPPQVVFMEQCVRLVRSGGLIGIVVPESMISSKKYSFVVDYIMCSCRVRAVIGMPDDLFKTSGKGGTHTKTCLLVLEKNSAIYEEPYDIFMAEAKWCGHDSRGREIPKDDIPAIVDLYKKYVDQGTVPNTHLGFLISSSDIENYVLAPRAYTYKVIGESRFDENSYILKKFGQLIEENVIQVSTGDEVGKLSYGTGTIPFVRTSDISNWEIKSDPKHLLSESIFEQLAGKQDVREGDILMVKDGSYLIGTCAMISKYDTRIVYQSHLYKIRVMENNYGIDNYFLLAALSSEYLKKQIRSKTFSQDIINSLGDRLKDLVIPVPIDRTHIMKISSMVKRSIDDSIEARELAKRARAEVFV